MKKWAYEHSLSIVLSIMYVVSVLAAFFVYPNGIDRALVSDYFLSISGGVLVLLAQLLLRKFLWEKDSTSEDVPPEMKPETHDGKNVE